MIECRTRQSFSIRSISSFIIYSIVIILTIYWHEWKVFALIFLFVLANNFTLLANFIEFLLSFINCKDKIDEIN